MLTKDFYFNLPPELVAQKPSGTRGNDRLLVLQKADGSVSHRAVADLPNLLPPGTLLVFNNSRVRRSRMYAKAVEPNNVTEAASPDTQHKEIEVLFLNALDDTALVWKTLVKNAKKQKNGKRFVFPGGKSAVITENPPGIGTEFRTLQFSSPIDEDWFEKNGHIPLPPYIKRADTEEDGDRYQTVYAKETGSAAAPTAGLHFTESMLEHLKKRGMELVYVTLHVGLGTFLPVRSEHIEDHAMHEEFFHICAETARAVENAKREGRPVLAVGTTSVRTLESAWNGEEKRLKTGSSSTRIFMYPGYRFKCADMLFTNFHTPESTLVMLVSAFAGKEAVFAAYEDAVREKYRFFSYGDAMLIR